MLRRWIVLLACAGIVAALGLGYYLPQHFSPVPGLVAELKSCLETDGDQAHEVVREPDSGEFINIELLIAGFNTTKAGTALLANAENEGEVVRGTVKDETRLRSVLVGLRSAGCLNTISRPCISTESGSLAYMMTGQEIPVVSAVGGVSSIEQKQFGTTVRALPTRMENGQIHLQLEVTESDARPFLAGPGGAAVKRGCEILTARISTALLPGQSCFIGGLKRKTIDTEDYRLPLASDLPGIGSWFHFMRSVEIDEELFILATLKPASARHMMGWPNEP